MNNNQLDFNDSYEENKRKFVNRLVEAGWDREEAEKEYENQVGEFDDGDGY